MRVTRTILLALMLAWPPLCSAGTPATPKKMQVEEVFDAGQPQALILKLRDASNGVICYLLMPQVAARTQVDSAWIYDGNSVGAISCVPSPTLPESRH